MNVYTCVDHDGHYVGVASVVIARDETEARAVLDAELKEHRLLPYSQCRYKLRQINTEGPRAFVLQDGDY